MQCVKCGERQSFFSEPHINTEVREVTLYILMCMCKSVYVCFFLCKYGLHHNLHGPANLCLYLYHSYWQTRLHTGCSSLNIYRTLITGTGNVKQLISLHFPANAHLCKHLGGCRDELCSKERKHWNILTKVSWTNQKKYPEIQTSRKKDKRKWGEKKIRTKVWDERKEML